MRRSALIFSRGCPAPRILSRFAVCLALCSAVVPARAGELRITAPSAPGTGWDQIAQALKSVLADERGEETVHVSNVPGGGGTVGLAKFLAEGGSDGLLVTGLTMVNAATLHGSPVGPDALTPVARLCAEPFVVAVPAASPFKTIDDIAMAVQADPAKVTWAGGALGSIDHTAAMLLARALRIEPGRLGYAPFLTSHDAVAALVEREVAAVIVPIGELGAESKSGRLRILAVGSQDRIQGADAPTLIESGLPVELANWRGLLGSRNIEPERLTKLLDQIQTVIGSRAWRDLLDKRGCQTAFMATDVFGQFIRREQARMKSALKAAGLLKRPSE